MVTKRVRAFLVFGTLGVVCGSTAQSQPALQPLGPPSVPALSALSGGSLPAHSDYVEVTYVTPYGETVASDEAVLSLSASQLTLVHSPTPRNGAIGYNVFAVKNNGGTRTGETLQNSSPIAFRANHSEPLTGWTTTGRPPPQINTSLVPARQSPAALPRGVTLLSVPPAPLLGNVAGGAFPAHSDHIRITYVTAYGETPASDQSVITLPANLLTVVHSPLVMSRGVIGYNVYAVRDDSSGQGETLQNASPIPIGTDYVEPPAGWTMDGVTPPATNTAVAPISNTDFPVGTTASYAAIPLVSSEREGSGGAMIIPGSDGRPGTVMSAVAAPPSGFNVSGKTLETFKFVFNHDVTFEGFPAFKPSLPAGTKSSPPYVVEIHDGTNGQLLGIMPSFARSKLTFLGDPAIPFKALRNRPYYANVVANAAYEVSLDIPKRAASIALPSVDHIRASVDLPGAEDVKDSGGSFDVIVSKTPATGLPPLSGADVANPIYYASVTVWGTAWYNGSAVVKIALPPALLSGRKTYSLAAYDSGFAHLGWLYGIRPVEQTGGTLTFMLPMPHFIAWRQYGFALYDSPKAAPQPLRHPGPSPAVVVVGDSVSYLTIMPPSGSGCVPGWEPLPECQYSNDPSVTWPGILARITGKSVLNLSQLGTTTTVDAFFGPSMLGLQVPQIPADTKVVICEWGDADLGLSGQSPATSLRALDMTKAILQRAPHARLIYIGIHCMPGCDKPGIAAWEEEDQRLAARYGAFVDLKEVGKDGMNADFPDGGHLSLRAARALAEKVSGRMHRWGY